MDVGAREGDSKLFGVSGRATVMRTFVIHNCQLSDLL